MLDFILTQERLPEHVGWHLRVEAYADPEFVGLGDREDLWEAINGGRTFRAARGERGYRVASISGVLGQGFRCYDIEELARILDNALEVGSGTFDVSSEAYMAAGALRAWIEREEARDFLDFEEFQAEGIMAIESFTCVPGVRPHPMLCRLFAELQANVTILTSIVAAYQQPDPGEISRHQAVALAADLASFPSAAERLGLNGAVATKGCRFRGEEPQRHRPASFDPDLRPEDLATLVLVMNGDQIWDNDKLWGMQEKAADYIDAHAWADAELGITPYELPPGTDGERDR